MLMAGVLSGEYIFNYLSSVIALSTLSLTLLISLFTRKSGIVQSISLLFAIFLTGICLYRYSVESIRIARPGYYDYNAVVISSVKQNKGFSSFDIIKTDKHGEHKIKATVKGYTNLYPGDLLHIHSKINPPRDKNKKRFSYAEYLIRNGYYGTTFLNRNKIEFIGNNYEGLSSWMRLRVFLLQIRSSLLSKLNDNGLKGRDFATVSAMAFGEKTYLSSNDKDIYSRTGVSHVLALSGLHIGIIYTFLTFFMTFIHKKTRFVLIQAAVWFYVVFAGMSPSLIRAALMISIYSLGTLMHRDKISLNSLSFAGCLSVILSPQIIFDLCFQLSFISVFSIMLFYRPITEILPSHPSVIKKIMQMTAVSLAAYIGTMPIILHNFGSLSLCFLITNLIVIPLTTAVIYLAILSFVPFLGTYIICALIAVVHMLNTIINAMSNLSFANIGNLHISILNTILIYVVIIILYILYCLTNYKKINLSNVKIIK